MQLDSTSLHRLEVGVLSVLCCIVGVVGIFYFRAIVCCVLVLYDLHISQPHHNFTLCQFLQSPYSAVLDPPNQTYLDASFLGDFIRAKTLISDCFGLKLCDLLSARTCSHLAGDHMTLDLIGLRVIQYCLQCHHLMT